MGNTAGKSRDRKLNAKNANTAVVVKRRGFFAQTMVRAVRTRLLGNRRGQTTSRGAPAAAAPQPSVSFAPQPAQQANPAPDEEHIPQFSRESSKRNKSLRNLLEAAEQEAAGNNVPPEVQAVPEVSTVAPSQAVDGQPEAVLADGAVPLVEEQPGVPAHLQQGVPDSHPAEDPAAPPKLGSEADIEAKCNALLLAWGTRNIDAVRPAVIAIRKLLSIERSPPIQQILDGGAGTVLCEALREYWQLDAELCFETLWGITNIASGTNAQTQFVIDMGVLPVVRDVFVQSANLDCIEQATWCLGNIAGDTVVLRDLVLSFGIAESIANRLIMFDVKLSLRRNLAWLGSNLCRGKPHPNMDSIRPIMVSAAACIARGSAEDTEIIVDSLWTISYCSDGPNERISAVLETGVLASVCNIASLLTHNTAALPPAVRIAGNVASGTDVQTQALLDSNGIALFESAIQSGRSTLQKEACWGLSNIAAGTTPQREALLRRPEVLERVSQLVRTGASGDVLKEATFVFANLVDDAPISLVQACLKQFPISQLLLYAFNREGPIQLVAQAGLRSLLKAPLSNCMEELRRFQIEELRVPILEESFAIKVIEQENGLNEVEASSVIWMLLSMGLPDRRQSQDGETLVSIFDDIELSDAMRTRIFALRNITMLAGLSSMLKSRLPKNTVWLPLDLWRVMWEYVFE